MDRISAAELEPRFDFRLGVPITIIGSSIIQNKAMFRNFSRPAHRNQWYRWPVAAAFAFLALGEPVSCAANTDCPPQIRVAYADSELPPYILGVGTELQQPPGLFVTWARTAFARLGCSNVVQEIRLPYNRIINNMGSGTVDIRISGGYRAELQDVMQYPMYSSKPDAALAIAGADTRLYVLKNSRPLQWDGKALRKADALAVVGTVRGHFSEKMLETRNWNLESAASWEANVKKLIAGRVDAIAGSDSVVDALPERDQMVPLNPPVQYDLFFAPVSQQFYKNYPGFTHKFWFEICQQSRSTFKTLPPCRKL